MELPWGVGERHASRTGGRSKCPEGWERRALWLHGIAFKSSGGISSRQIEQVDGALDEAFGFTLALGAAAATS